MFMVHKENLVLILFPHISSLFFLLPSFVFLDNGNGIFTRRLPFKLRAAAALEDIQRRCRNYMANKRTPTTPFSTCFSHIVCSSRFGEASSFKFDGMKNCSIVKAGTFFSRVFRFWKKKKKRFSGKYHLNTLTHTRIHTRFTHADYNGDNLISFYRFSSPKIT